MDYKEFEEVVIREMKKAFPDYIVEMNDEKYLTIKKPGIAVAPAIRINSIYESNHDDMSEVITRLIATVEAAFENAPKINTEGIYEWDVIKERIFLSLENNEEVDEKYISERFTDTTSLFPLIDFGDGVSKISKKLCEMWETTEEEVLRVAKENAWKKKPGTVEEMMSAMSSMSKSVPEGDAELCAILQKLNEDLEAEERQYVITTIYGVLGAVAITYPPIQKELEKIFGSRFLIIPSSKHEVIALKYEEDRIEEIADSLKQVNREILEKKDILCNWPMLYENGVIREV